MTVRQATVDEVLPLRARILRPDLPLESCRYPADAAAVHFAVESGGELVSVVTAHPENSTFAKDARNPWRIRGMATAREFQAQGFGSNVLKGLVDWAQTQDVDLLWCNARE